MLALIPLFSARFVSAAFMTLVSPVFVWKFGATSLLEKYSLAELIGLRTTGDPSEHYCRSVNSNNLHSRVTSSLYSTSVVDNDSVPRPYCHAFAGCEFNIRSLLDLQIVIPGKI